jgi:O-antigen/teichoic acid export membrane protein
VLTLLTGTVAAQGLAYLARPLLTRLFTPDAFGVLGFYLAAVTVLSTVASGKYEDAVLLPASDRDAAGVAALALGLGTVAALFSLALLPLHGPIAAALDRPDVALALLLVPAGLLATVWGRTAELWLTRMDRFRPISGAKVTQNAVMVPAQIGAGAAGGTALGLMGGHLAGRIVGTVVLLARAWRGTRALVPHTADLRRLAARYRRFPLYAMPSGFLNTFSMQLPAFFLLALFAPDVLGYYVLAYGTLAVPMQLLGGAVGQVFFARAAEARWEGTLGPLARTVFGRLSALGLFPMAALTIAAPAAFSVVFGAEWREAGVYAQLLAPWLYFVFVSAPLSSLFDVLERQPLELGFNVVVVAARAAALWFGGQYGGPLGAVGLFGAVSAVLWLGHTVWMLRWSGVALREAARVVGRHVLIAAGPLALVVAATALGASDGLVVAVLVGTGLVWLGLTARFEPGLWPRPAEDALS